MYKHANAIFDRFAYRILCNDLKVMFLPSLFLPLGRVVVTLMAGRPDQWVPSRVVTRAPLGVQARALYKTR